MIACHHRNGKILLIKSSPLTVQPKNSTKTNSNPKTKSKQKSQSQSQTKQQPRPTTISQTQEQTHQLQKINFRKPKPKPKISKVKREMREKFLYLISSGHRSNEACPKCSPLDRVSERDSSGHRSNEVCHNHRSERASERKRGSCDGERELRRREEELRRGS